MSRALLVILGLALLSCTPHKQEPPAGGAVDAGEPETSAVPQGAAGAAAEASGEVLLRDDFSDPASGWTVRNAGDYRNEYRDGVYVSWVDNARSSYIGNLTFLDRDLGDVRIEVDATKRSGSPSADVGVVCRQQPRGQVGRYYGEVDEEGAVRVGAYADSEEILARAERPGIWQPGANRLQLDCVGERITFWLNGERLLSATDSRWSSGRIGLLAGGGRDEATEVAFDNLVVSAAQGVVE
jgi:hypothetical protein